MRRAETMGTQAEAEGLTLLVAENGTGYFGVHYPDVGVGVGLRDVGVGLREAEIGSLAF